MPTLDKTSYIKVIGFEKLQIYLIRLCLINVKEFCHEA